MALLLIDLYQGLKNRTLNHLLNASAVFFRTVFPLANNGMYLARDPHDPVCMKHWPPGRMNNVLCMEIGPFKIFTHAVVPEKLSMDRKDNYQMLICYSLLSQ